MAVKRYLVTGAAGFIGANFIKDLVNRYGDNIDILVLDALTYAGNLMTISALSVSSPAFIPHTSHRSASFP